MTQKGNIEKNVMSAIKSGKVFMRSRAHFLLKSAGAVLGVLFILGALLYVVSFILFMLRVNGVLAFPSFGLPGLLVLFSSLPWLLILLALVLIAILEVLSKKFSFVYRQPVLYSLVAIVALVGGIGILVDKTPFHVQTASFLERHQFPGGRFLYEQVGAVRFRQAGAGIVVEIGDDGFVIEDPRGNRIVVATSSETRFPGEDQIDIDDRVVILGRRNLETDIIEALGILPFDPDLPFEPFEQERRGPGGMFFHGRMK